MLVPRDLEAEMVTMVVVGHGRGQSFLVLIVEALRYLDLWSHMGETEGTRALAPRPWAARECTGPGSTDARKGA